MGPQFGETIYISGVNGAREVKSNAHVAMSKNSDTEQKCYPWVAGEDSTPNSFLTNFWNCQKPVKTNSRKYDVSHVTR